MKLSLLREISRRFPMPDNPEAYQKIKETLKQEGIDLQNFYQELEMSAPMVETHRDESYTNANISLHSHDFFEMLFIMLGDYRDEINTGLLGKMYKYMCANYPQEELDF